MIRRPCGALGGVSPRNSSAPTSVRPAAVDSYDCFLISAKPTRLLHIQLRRSVERVVARLDDRGTGDRPLDSIEVVDRDEEHRRVANEVVRRLGLLRQHARACLVHDFDVAGFRAGKYQLAVVAGDLVLGGEAELVNPEAQARLDFVDDENGRQVPQAECVCCCHGVRPLAPSGSRSLRSLAFSTR